MEDSYGNLEAASSTSTEVNEVTEDYFNNYFLLLLKTKMFLRIRSHKINLILIMMT